MKTIFFCTTTAEMKIEASSLVIPPSSFKVLFFPPPKNSPQTQFSIFDWVTDWLTDQKAKAPHLISRLCWISTDWLQSVQTTVKLIPKYPQRTSKQPYGINLMEERKKGQKKVLFFSN